ncbi:MAG: Low molecular weight protein-tyrosine-phosphatase YfkJ [Gammaproteobacteria bacterium]|nr:Low molecular weight protein-tyrosine-phosphatase YfkJ [Gammaproteobacteria bacterium]
MQVKVLFVCLGNICRSPTAEGVFRKLLEREELESRVHVDSAGTHAYHVGAPPDQRAREAALRRGIDLSAIRGRQAEPSDILEFDLALAMDRENYENLITIAGGHAHKVRLFMEFSDRFEENEVPDPYYGGPNGFEQVLDMIEDASEGLIRELRRLRSFE